MVYYADDPNQDYKTWVKEASAEKLVAELLEVYEDVKSAKEDNSLYVESGEETEANFNTIREEIIRRASQDQTLLVAK